MSHLTDEELLWVPSRASSNTVRGSTKETTHLYLVGSIVLSPPIDRIKVEEAIKTCGDNTDNMLAENESATLPTPAAIGTDAPPAYFTEKTMEAGNDKTGERHDSAVEESTVTEDSILLKVHL